MGKSSANNLIFVQGIWNGINLINADIYINPSWFLLQTAKINSENKISLIRWISLQKFFFFFPVGCTPQLTGISGNICTGDTIRDVSKICFLSEMYYKQFSQGEKIVRKTSVALQGYCLCYSLCFRRFPTCMNDVKGIKIYYIKPQ